MNSARPIVIAHRGASAEAPENTLAAFRLALAQQCDGIELDIRFSRDGDVVVCHDATIDRTTTGQGAIRTLGPDALRAADAGSWFSPAFGNERLPLLAEVLELLPPDVLLNVELKDAESPQFDGTLLELLRPRLEQVLVSSFNHEGVARLKRLEPRLRIGLLFDRSVSPDLWGAIATPGVPVYSIHPQMSIVDRDMIGGAHSLGLRVYPYTVNEPADVQRLAKLGVDGLITDRPAATRRLLHA